jgi:hypothetical protein
MPYEIDIGIVLLFAKIRAYPVLDFRHVVLSAQRSACALWFASFGTKGTKRKHWISLVIVYMMKVWYFLSTVMLFAFPENIAWN